MVLRLMSLRKKMRPGGTTLHARAKLPMMDRSSHCMHVLMRDENEGRKKQGQTNNKVKQHNTPRAVTFPKKNELPRVGRELTTLYTLDRALNH